MKNFALTMKAPDGLCIILERGIKTGIQYFDNEDDACDYLLYAIEESASGKY